MLVKDSLYIQFAVAGVLIGKPIEQYNYMVWIYRKAKVCMALDLPGLWAHWVMRVEGLTVTGETNIRMHWFKNETSELCVVT